MPECPFCHVEVEEELVLYGGSCPHCFNAIPGEEAPTDPGVSPKAAPSGTESNSSWVVAAALVLLVGGGGAVGLGGFTSEGSQEVPPTVEVKSLEVRERDLEAEAKAMAEAYALGNPQDTQGLAEELNQAAGVVEVKKSRSAPVRKPTLRRSSAPEATAKPSFSASGGPVVVPRRARLEPDPLYDADEVAEAITHTLRANSGRFEQCYNQRLKGNDSLRGSWMVSFTVMPSGVTQGVRVRALKMRDDVLEECLGRQMGSLTFPKISEASPFAKKYHFGVR